MCSGIKNWMPKIAQAVVSINAFKGVEFGVGFEAGVLPGSQVMDEILWDQQKGYTRRSNNLGGFEGGMTNGEPICCSWSDEAHSNVIQTVAKR